MELASTGDLRRSLALRRNAPSGAPIAIRSPCLCQIPSHIIDDVTATFRARAVPPLLLRCQYQRLVHGAFTTLKYLSPNDFLGPTGLWNEGESNGLPNKNIKGKKKKDSYKNVKSSLRIDGLGNTDANL
jgi:hypothetical protein